MPYAAINDLEMYYEELGSTEAPPLVLLHGAGGTADDPVGGWASLAPGFAERFRVFLTNTAVTAAQTTPRAS